MTLDEPKKNFKSQRRTTMKDLITKATAFIRDEDGASAVEYGLLIAGIAVAVMAGIYAIGTALSGKFDSVKTKLGG
jgi:pilus assembly protein Flp/PilA